MGRQSRLFPVGKLVLEKKGKQDKCAIHAISLQYTWKGLIARKATSIKCTSEHWNSNTCELRASYGDSWRRDNEYLSSIKSKYDALIKDYIQNSSNTLTIEIIRDILGDKKIFRPDKGIDFAEFAKDILNSKYSRHKIGHSRYMNGISAINMFTEFLMSTHGGTYKPGAIYVSDITPDIIDKHIDWRRKIKHNSDETINHALTPILTAVEAASNLGYITPKANATLQEMRIETAKKIDDDEKEFDGRYLTQENLNALIAEYSRIKEVRRKEYIEMFLFAFHACGIRVIDLMTLQWNHINFEKREIKKVQVKTSKRHTIPLTDPAIKILEKWKSKEIKNKFVFDLLPNDFDVNNQEALYRHRNSKTQAINQSLIPVGERLGLAFNLTMHVARHTFAVLALNSGINMSVVSRLLGHSSTDVTERVYAQFLPETLAAEVDKLKLDYLPTDL